MRLLPVVFTLCCINVFGQVAEGVVINKTTKQPISYTSIYLKSNSSLGTVSNIEGRFRLRITAVDSVIFTHVGFKRKSVSTKSFDGTKTIELEEQHRMLSEVIIMPDSNLLTLLRRAYSKIETNYPESGTVFEGFYREANQVDENHKFVYFAESTIEFFKPGYGNKRFGPVRIIKGGKSEVESRSKYSNIYFYAGVYAPQRFDFVKERFEFIDPKDFHLYRYTLESIIKDGDNETYEIAFAPRTRSGALYKGTFHIDKKTLAYTSLTCDLTSEGLRDRNSRRLSNVSYTSGHFEIHYRELDGRWYINFVVVDGKLENPKFNNHIRYTAEYVTTSLRPSEDNPIKESEAIPYSAIYTQQEEKFSEGYWNESETIARSSELEQHVSLLFTKSDLKIEADSSKKIDVVIKPNKLPIFLKIALRLRTSYGLTMVPIENTSGVLSAAYGNTFRTQSIARPKRFVWAMDYEFSYRFYRSFSGFANITFGDLSESQDFNIVRLGINYSKKLAGWRRPLTLQAGASFAVTSIHQQLASSFATSDFEVNRKSFTSSKRIDAAVGQYRGAIMPSLQLHYNIRPMMQIFGGVSLYAPVGHIENYLTLSQRKSFLTARSASIPLDEVDFRIDNDVSTSSPIKIPTNALFARVGISLGF